MRVGMALSKSVEQKPKKRRKSDARKFPQLVVTLVLPLPLKSCRLSPKRNKLEAAAGSTHWTSARTVCCRSWCNTTFASRVDLIQMFLSRLHMLTFVVRSELKFPSDGSFMMHLQVSPCPSVQQLYLRVSLVFRIFSWHFFVTFQTKESSSWRCFWFPLVTFNLVFRSPGRWTEEVSAVNTRLKQSDDL